MGEYKVKPVVAWPNLPEWNSYNSVAQSEDPNNKKEEVPEPNNKEDLVIDHVETENTKSIFLLLFSPRSIPENYNSQGFPFCNAAYACPKIIN